MKKMTVKDLINQLLEYPSSYEVQVDSDDESKSFPIKFEVVNRYPGGTLYIQQDRP